MFWHLPSAWAHSHEDAEASAGPKLENLLAATLEGVEGNDVVVSRVTLPAHTALPKHWHPGEEFAYVIEGEVTLYGWEVQAVAPKSVTRIKNRSLRVFDFTAIPDLTNSWKCNTKIGPVHKDSTGIIFLFGQLKESRTQLQKFRSTD